MTNSGKSKKKDQAINIGKKYSMRSKFSRRNDLIGYTCQIPMTKATKNTAILFYISWMVMLIFNQPAVLCNS